MNTTATTPLAALLGGLKPSERTSGVGVKRTPAFNRDDTLAIFASHDRGVSWKDIHETLNKSGLPYPTFKSPNTLAQTVRNCAARHGIERPKRTKTAKPAA